jgi:hypothetical protein
LASPIVASSAHAEGITSKQAAQRLKNLAAKDSQVQKHLRYICKEIGLRLTGSDNLQKAYEWTRGQFASYGLDARLEKCGTAPVGFNRGQSTGKMISAQGERVLSFGTQAWTAGTNGPVRGAATLAPKTVKEIDALGDKLAGAWIVGTSSSRFRRGSNPVTERLWKSGIAGFVSAVRNELIVTGGRHRNRRCGTREP